MSGNIPRRPEDRVGHYDDLGFNGGRAVAPSSYADRPYGRQDNQEKHSYDDKVGQSTSGARVDGVRGSDDRHKTSVAHDSGTAYQQRQSARSSLDGTIDRSAGRQGEDLNGTARINRFSAANALEQNPTAQSHESKLPAKPGGAISEKVPDLSDLKAKALATLPKRRDASSSTPTRDLLGPGKVSVGTSDSESTSKIGDDRWGANISSPTPKKDSSTAIDDLLAEGKAAAAAKEMNSCIGTTAENGPNRSKAVELFHHSNYQRQHHHRESRAVENRETSPKKRMDGERRELTRSLNGLNHHSPGPSEQGEIVDDLDVSFRSPPTETEVRKGATSTPSAVGNSERHERVPYVQPREVFPRVESRNDARRDSFGTSYTSPRSISKPDPREYEREWSYRATRKASDSTVSHHGSEHYGRLKEPQPAYDGDSRRPSADGSLRPRDTYLPRNSKESDKGMAVRRSYSTRRVIEIDDDDNNEPPLIRAPPEPKETFVRKYVEEQPRASVIHLSDAYWADLEEWLEYTGYHDRAYRRDTLRRHKEMLELDLRKALLARESQAAQEERAYKTRGVSVQPREEPTTGAPRVSTLPRNLRSSSAIEMPPPPIPAREERELVGRLERTDSSPTGKVGSKPAYTHAAKYGEDKSGRVQYANSPTYQAENATLKRRHHSDDEDIDRRPSEKLVRVGSYGRAPARGDEEVSSQRSLRTYQGDDREDRRVREADKGSERLFKAELGKLRVQEGAQRPHKEPMQQRGRDAQPPISVAREPPTILTPQHRAAKEATAFRTYQPEEDKSKGHQNGTSRAQAGYPRDITPPRKPQGGLPARPSTSQGPPRSYARDSFSEVRSFDDNKGGFQSRPGIGNHPYSPSGRGRGRARGSFSASNRQDHRVYNHNHAYLKQMMAGAQGLDLMRGDVRYFIMKSFNHENVQIAQNENIWVTQDKNSAVLLEAYNTCRHVILFFSVNKSMHFQGYALMESAPGTARPPSWATSLFWKPSGPFRLRWLTIADTHFRRVGHLKNAMNENSPILIGRDGQEVEHQAARDLCALIDEEAERLWGIL